MSIKAFVKIATSYTFQPKAPAAAVKNRNREFEIVIQIFKSLKKRAIKSEMARMHFI